MVSGTRFFCKQYAEKICMGVESVAVADTDNRLFRSYVKW